MLIRHSIVRIDVTVLIEVRALIIGSGTDCRTHCSGDDLQIFSIGLAVVIDVTRALDVIGVRQARDPEQRRSYLNTLKAESDRLSRLVENVLSYSRLEDGRYNSHPETLGLATLMERVAPVLERVVVDVVAWSEPNEIVV